MATIEDIDKEGFEISGKKVLAILKGSACSTQGHVRDTKEVFIRYPGIDGLEGVKTGKCPDCKKMYIRPYWEGQNPKKRKLRDYREPEVESKTKS